MSSRPTHLREKERLITIPWSCVGNYAVRYGNDVIVECLYTYTTYVYILYTLVYEYTCALINIIPLFQTLIGPPYFGVEGPRNTSIVTKCSVPSASGWDDGWAQIMGTDGINRPPATRPTSITQHFLTVK